MVKDHMGGIKSRKNDSHKGDYGKLLVVAGSKGMTGAAYLCCMGALRSGSGLVTCSVPDGLSDIMEIKLTEVMTLPVSSSAGGGTFAYKALDELLDFSRKCNSVAIGPGLGVSSGVRKLVRELVSKIECPLVIDADALNVMSEKVSEIKGRVGQTVITPHPGEAARLLKCDVASIQEDRTSSAKKLSDITGAVTCLKGHGTVVCGTTGEVFVNDTGNTGMATAGTGDILTGMIASFIGQGLTPYGAAVSGVYIHGLAGDVSAQKKGVFSMTAGDILDDLHEAFAKAGL